VCSYDCFFSQCWSTASGAPVGSSCLLANATSRELATHSYCYGKGGEREDESARERESVCVCVCVCARSTIMACEDRSEHASRHELRPNRFP
jgi:hypothetical protein